MSHALRFAPAIALNDHAHMPLVARWAMSFAVTVTKWDTRRRTRKQLAQLDHAQLIDIGLTRTQAEREAAKPFWQA